MFVSHLQGQASVRPGTSSSRDYFVDCSRAANGNGDSPDSPWNSLDSFQSRNFLPGDVIKLRRGTECRGVLSPKGSGKQNATIHLTAYGEGPRPKIVAPPGSHEVFRLFNQQYWDVDSLDLSGGIVNGVFISGDSGILHHIHLSNLLVHDVAGTEMKHKEGGLVAVTPGSVDQHFDDILVDGVTAWKTNQWVGILVGGGNLGFPPESTWSTNVSIRNSVVHDVQGDGIVLFREHGAKIENSVAWNTGMQQTESIGTPNAIWTWMCHDCTVEQTEAFLTDSPGVDGGAYDIDYGNTNNAVLNNYGHDTQGYCVAVFGAGFVTHQSVVRGNLCVNNGRSPRMAKYQGAIFLYTWNGGSIDGLAIENNTVYWSPYESAPALLNNAQINAGSAVVRDNTIYSTAPWLVDSNKSAHFESNRYTYFGSSRPIWRWDNRSFTNLTELQAGVQQESGSSFTQLPLRDWANVLPRTATKLTSDSIFDQRFINASGAEFPIKRVEDGWRLFALVPATFNESGLIDDDALKQIIFLKSLDLQYRARGLNVILLLAVDSRFLHSAVLRNAISDLDLAGIPVAYIGNSTDSQHTVLVAPEGQFVQRWNGFAGPAALGLVIRAWLGEPAFSQSGAGPNE